jgi:hypothetical protein
MLKIHYALQSTLCCYIMLFENAGAEFSARNEKFGNNIHGAKSYSRFCLFLVQFLTVSINLFFLLGAFKIP